MPTTEATTLEEPNTYAKQQSAATSADKATNKTTHGQPTTSYRDQPDPPYSQPTAHATAENTTEPSD